MVKRISELSHKEFLQYLKKRQAARKNMTDGELEIEAIWSIPIIEMLSPHIKVAAERILKEKEGSQDGN